MRPRDALVLATVVLAFLAASCTRQSAIDVNTMAPSVVRIAGTACLNPILATGFFVDRGHIVTVAHAVAGAKDDLHVVAADGATHTVRVVAFDPNLDIAVLVPDGLTGEGIGAGVGHPGDEGLIAAMNRDSQVDPIPYEIIRRVNARSGDIYDKGHVERDALDVRSVAGRGTSGAPLLDQSGDFVGMVFAISNDREDAVYAIASGEIEGFLAGAELSAEVERGYCR